MKELTKFERIMEIISYIIDFIGLFSTTTGGVRFRGIKIG